MLDGRAVRFAVGRPRAMLEPICEPIRSDVTAVLASCSRRLEFGDTRRGVCCGEGEDRGYWWPHHHEIGERLPRREETQREWIDRRRFSSKRRGWQILHLV